MIELRREGLEFSFPEVHQGATLTIKFQRTLRIPDDGHHYPLPPGLGAFPLRHVDDFATRVPPSWLEHGGVMLSMYQAEAMWLNFDARHIDGRDASYPFAIKVATGKINAVSGEAWTEGLNRRPQDYLVAPPQPWLDGYCVNKGHIRQFIAMPLGAGYTAEEQITGKAEHGGLQVMVIPMKREVFERRFPRRERLPAQLQMMRASSPARFEADPLVCGSLDVGLAPGGLMRQQIYDDPFNILDWDVGHASRCFVHLTNSMVWRDITGQEPPSPPLSSQEYSRAGLPWFEYYREDATAVQGSSILRSLKSVLTLGKEKREQPLPENQSVDPARIVEIRKKLGKYQVREGAF